MLGPWNYILQSTKRKGWRTWLHLQFAYNYVFYCWALAWYTQCTRALLQGAPFEVQCLAKHIGIAYCAMPVQCSVMQSNARGWHALCCICNELFAVCCFALLALHLCNMHYAILQWNVWGPMLGQAYEMQSIAMMKQWCNAK